jgi:hypothetical protein
MGQSLMEMWDAKSGDAMVEAAAPPEKKKKNLTKNV